MKSTYHIFFTHLANPLKMDIILLLRKGELCVGDIADKLNCEQSKLSHSLASLKQCNILGAKRMGKNMCYFLNDKTIVPILDLIDKHAKVTCGKPGCACSLRKK